MSDELIAPKASNLNQDSIEITRKTLRGKPSKPGTISEQIGTGEDAKNSIVWITVRWSLILGGLLSFALYFRPAYCSSDYSGSLIEDIKATWSIFMPVITLALGYIFGKSK